MAPNNALSFTNPAVAVCMCSVLASELLSVVSLITRPVVNDVATVRIDWSYDNCEVPTPNSIRFEELNGYATMPLRLR